MRKYFNTVQDMAGEPVTAATVTVTDYPAGTASTIYSDDGVTAYGSNVVTTDGRGYFEFYAANGTYSITISDAGIVDYTIDDIELHDPEDTVTFSDGITVTGNSSITGDLTVTGDYTVTGDINITGDYSVTGDLTVTGDCTVAGASLGYAVADKAEAAALSLTSSDAGRKIAVVSDDGGEFIVKYDAGAPYADDGGSYCGTQFIPTGGDGTIGIVRYGSYSVLKPEWWGVVADGENTDNNTALMNMRSYMLADNTKMYTVCFSPGTYGTSNNKWIKGIKRIHLIVYGCKFVNTSAGTHGYTLDEYAFLPQHGYFSDASGVDDFSPSTNISGYLIDTTTAGDSTVTTSTASEAGNLSAGDKVLVLGYAQATSGGYPPNIRYFEYAEVSDADSGTGVVTLTKRLKHRYRSDWKDYTYYSVTQGAARIVNLNRTNYDVIEKLIIEGMETIEYSGGSGNYNGGLAIVGVMDAYLKNCRANRIWPSECGRLTLENCDVYEGMETDKIIDSVTIIGGNVYDFSQATGCRMLKITNGCELTGTFQSRARQTLIDDCDVALEKNATYGYMMEFTGFANQLTKLTNNRISIGAATSVVNGGTYVTFDVDTVVDNETIKIDYATNASVVSLIEIGCFISKNSDSAGQTGVVTDFYDDGTGNNLIIKARFADAPVAAETYRLWSTHRLIEKDNVFVDADPSQVQFDYQNMRSRGFDSSLNKMNRVVASRVYKDGVYEAIHVHGYITNIFVNVQRAFTGSDTSATLDIANQGSGGSKTYCSIDLTVAGIRQMTPFATNGAETGDTLNTTAEVLCEELILHPHGDSTGQFDSYADPTELPIVTVIIEAILWQ